MENQGPVRKVQRGRKNSHPVQLGAIQDFSVGLDSRFIKQEPEENLQQPWDVQWQDFLKAMQPSRSGQKRTQLPSPARSAENSRSLFKETADLSQRPGRKSLTRLLPGPIKDCQDFISSVRVKEEILDVEETFASDTERQRFRQFCYLEAEGPKESFFQLQALCWQWLKPERRTKKQILDLLVLEQFLAILPPEVQGWVKEGKPGSCAQTVALAEDYFLRVQQAEGLQEKVSCPGEEVTVINSSNSEQVPSEAVNSHLSAEAEEESDEDASYIGNDQGYENEEETFSFERHPQIGISGVSLARLNGKLYQVCGLEEMAGSEPRQEIHQENQSGIPAFFHEESLRENTFPPGRDRKGKRKNTGPPSWGTVLNHGFEFPPSRKMQKLYTCTYCGKVSNNSAHMIIHERTHTGEKPYKCSACGKCFSTNCNLMKHTRVHTGEKPYQCPECGRSFSDKASLIVHERTHTGEKPYECPMCGKSFTSSSNLITHKRVHTGEKPYKCSECGQSFVHRPQLVIHIRTHTGEKPYECPECGKSFNQKADLIIHRRIHTGEKPYECPECGKSFISSSYLRKHERLHAGKKALAGEESHKCGYCRKSFISRSKLLIHERTHTGEKPFECADCGKSFSTSSNLVNHKRVHTGEKPYQCSDCGQKFSTNSNLVNHRRVHTGEKPYNCTDCGQNFGHKASLRRHKRIHSREATRCLLGTGAKC